MVSMKMVLVLFSLIFIFIQPAVAHVFVNNTGQNCCYGGKSIEHGGLIASFPDQCLQLFCDDGDIEQVYCDNPLQCGCCEFNGKMYKNGQKIGAICIEMICKDGEWTTTGIYDPCCGLCTVKDDPHIKTFDGKYYGYHGKCNYSISQHGTGYNEDFGIYGLFKECLGGIPGASCVDVTTFVDNPNTVIVYEHGNGNNVKVNDIPYVVKPFVEKINVGGIHPVMAWTMGSCNMFLGSQGYLVKMCPNNVFIWAYPNLIERIFGLCGFYNEYLKDDCKKRDGSIQTTPLFGNDWLTDPQPDPDCEVTGPPPECDDMDYYRTICTDLLLEVEVDCKRVNFDVIFKASVETCAFDLCFMHQNGKPQADIDLWKIELKIIFQLEIEIDCHTGPEPPKPECPHKHDSKSGCSCCSSHVEQLVQFVFKSKSKRH